MTHDKIQPGAWVDPGTLRAFQDNPDKRGVIGIRRAEMIYPSDVALYCEPPASLLFKHGRPAHVALERLYAEEITVDKCIELILEQLT